MPSHTTPQEELKDEITAILYGADWKEDGLEGTFKPDVEAVMQLIEAEASRRSELKAQLAYEAGLETYDIEEIERAAHITLLDELQEVVKNQSYAVVGSPLASFIQAKRQSLQERKD